MMRTRLLGVPQMISLFFAAPCLASTNLITTGGMEGGVYPSFLQEDCTDFESCASAQNAGALEVVPDESDAYGDELGYALQFTASRDDEYTPPTYSGTSAVTAWFHGSSLHVCNVRGTPPTHTHTHTALFCHRDAHALTARALSVPCRRLATRARCSGSAAARGGGASGHDSTQLTGDDT